VAVKRVGDVFRSNENAKRMLREVCILRRVQHPCIIRLLDVFMKPSQTGRFIFRNGRFVPSSQDIYLVLEFCPLGDLFELRGQLGEGEVKALCWQILSAINFLHRQYVWHRDLKSANILVTLSEGRRVAKIADFGSSRSAFLGDPSLAAATSSTITIAALKTSTDKENSTSLLLSSTSTFSNVSAPQAPMTHLSSSLTPTCTDLTSRLAEMLRPGPGDLGDPGARVGMNGNESINHYKNQTNKNSINATTNDNVYCARDRVTLPPPFSTHVIGDRECSPLSHLPPTNPLHPPSLSAAGMGFPPLLTQVVCTPCYRAPEVVMSRGEYSNAMDAWSVGCIFGELIQRVPYVGKASTPLLQVAPVFSMNGEISTPQDGERWMKGEEAGSEESEGSSEEGEETEESQEEGNQNDNDGDDGSDDDGGDDGGDDDDLDLDADDGDDGEGQVADNARKVQKDGICNKPICKDDSRSSTSEKRADMASQSDKGENDPNSQAKNTRQRSCDSSASLSMLVPPSKKLKRRGKTGVLRKSGERRKEDFGAGGAEGRTEATAAKRNLQNPEIREKESAKVLGKEAVGLVAKKNKPLKSEASFKGSAERRKELGTLFSVIGTPSWRAIDNVRSKSWQRYLYKTPGKAPTIFRRFGMAGEVVCDLLTRLLVFDPRQRCTAEEALTHEYFSDVDRFLGPGLLQQIKAAYHELSRRGRRGIERGLRRQNGGENPMDFITNDRSQGVGAKDSNDITTSWDSADTTKALILLEVELARAVPSSATAPSSLSLSSPSPLSAKTQNLDPKELTNRIQRLMERECELHAAAVTQEDERMKREQEMAAAAAAAAAKKEMDRTLWISGTLTEIPLLAFRI